MFYIKCFYNNNSYIYKTIKKFLIYFISYFKFINEINFCTFFLQAKFVDFKIQNIVGSCDVKFPIRLEGLVLAHSQFCRFV